MITAIAKGTWKCSGLNKIQTLTSAIPVQSIQYSRYSDLPVELYQPNWRRVIMRVHDNPLKMENICESHISISRHSAQCSTS